MTMTVGQGLFFAAVLTEGGGLWVWGSHRMGSLGLGPPVHPYIPNRGAPALLGGVGTFITRGEGGGPGAAAHPFCASRS